MPDDLAEAFEICLTPDQLHDLGRLTATWSQIDFLIVLAISGIMQIEIHKVEPMLEDKMTGGRLALLKRRLPDIKDDKIRRIAQKFTEKMERLLGKRNHITHGIWGWHVDTKKKEARRASRFARSKNPLFAKNLKQLADECLVEARRINTVASHYTGVTPVPGKPPQYFFADGPPLETPPKFVE